MTAYWALIRLDGADTLLLHAVDAKTPAAIRTGARVHAHWADETVGAITDIAYFALAGDQPEPVREPDETRDPVTMIVTPIELTIQHTASHEERLPARHCRGQAAGRQDG
ncbi:hypothetical protein [Mycobacterium lacus]|uniref:hypothetical protein n=1 Tax=Mycobacterium lacus TaxID=169765 RepID=UPI0038B3F720